MTREVEAAPSAPTSNGHRRYAAEDYVRAVARQAALVKSMRRAASEHEQRVIDAEADRTRRELARLLRHRAGGDCALPFLDKDFLALADLPTVRAEIIRPAITVGGADRADLQLDDPEVGALRIVAHRGFDDTFLHFFATVPATASIPCATALTSREPVLVDDISQSPIFDPSSREAALAAGSRAVYSYPLHNGGPDLIGVLSFHHDEVSPRRRDDLEELIVTGAEKALR